MAQIRAGTGRVVLDLEPVSLDKTLLRAPGIIVPNPNLPHIASTLRHPSVPEPRIVIPHTPEAEALPQETQERIWDSLAGMVRKYDLGRHGAERGIRELRELAGPVAMKFGIAVNSIPLSSIWLHEILRMETANVDTIHELTKKEKPVLRQAIADGYLIDFIGGPINSFGKENKVDHLKTLRGRMRALAWRYPNAMKLATTFFTNELEDRLVDSEAQRIGFDRAQAHIDEHHATELETIAEVKASNGLPKAVIHFTGLWDLSRGSWEEFLKAVKLMLRILDHAFDKALNTIAVGHAEKIYQLEPA